MKTTIHLPDDLLNEVRVLAALSGKSVAAIIEEALREKLARQEQGGRRKRVQLPTFGGEGLHPEVDLDDSAALLDFMERHDDSP